MDILFEKVYTLVTITPQGVRRKLEVQDMGLNLSGMTTETRNPRTMQLDQMSPLEIVTVMNEEDARVPLAIAKCLPQIAQAVTWAACTKRRRKALKLLDFLDAQKQIYA